MAPWVMTHDGAVVDELVAYRPVFGLSKDRLGDGVWLTGFAYHELLVPQPVAKMIVMEDVDELRRDSLFAWGGMILRTMYDTMRDLLWRKR